MLEIAICEDKQADRERLQEMLHTILDRYSLKQQITCYSSGEELLNASLRFDLIFMDIVMEVGNGIGILNVERFVEKYGEAFSIGTKTKNFTVIYC